MTANQFLTVVLLMSLSSIESSDRHSRIQECIKRCEGERSFQIRRILQSEPTELDEILLTTSSTTTSPKVKQTESDSPPVLVDPITKYLSKKFFRPSGELFQPVTWTPSKITNWLFPTTETTEGFQFQLDPCRRKCFT